MSQKLFISFNAKDREKAHWIAWTLQEAGHQVAVHDWEIPAGGNVPLWMTNRLDWADRLVAVVSPDYVTAKYSAMEWAASLWDDPEGTKGALVPVVVRPTKNISTLLRGLSRLDLTGCDEAEATKRLLEGFEQPAPPRQKPTFEAIPVEVLNAGERGPANKPVFVSEQREGLTLRPKWILAILTLLALVGYFGFADRNCTTLGGGEVVCGDVVFGFTQEEYEKGLQQRIKYTRAEEAAKRKCAAIDGGEVVCGDVFGFSQEEYEKGLQQRAKDLRAEEAAKRVQLELLLAAIERAQKVEKATLRAQIATVEAEKRTLEQQIAELQRRLSEPEESYQALLEKLREAKAVLETLGPLAANKEFEQAQEALTRGEAEALFRQAIAIGEKTLGKEHPSVATRYNNLANLLRTTGRYEEAEPLYRQALAIGEKTLGKEHPDVAIDYSNLAGLLADAGRYEEAEPLYRQALAIDEKTLGREHPDTAIDYNNLAGLLEDTGRYEEAEALYRQALDIMISTLGTEHPYTQTVSNNLEFLLQQTNSANPSK